MSCKNKPATTLALLGMHFKKFKQFFKEPFPSANLQVLQNVRTAQFFALIKTFGERGNIFIDKKDLIRTLSNFAAFSRLLKVNFVPKCVHFLRIGEILQGH